MFEKTNFLLIFFVLIFGLIYFLLITPIKTDFVLEPRFDWPDETANFFWSKHYAATGGLVVAEPLNLIAQNQIHPRSFNVRSDGVLVPGSFLGLILFYGTLAKIFGTNLIIYFTPILGLFGALAFYGLIKRIFDQRIALLSFILLLLHPAWWYYTVTSLLPNIAFISLVLLSIYFLMKTAKRSLAEVLLASVFAGLAIAIRPIEIIWLSLVYLAVLFYQRSKINSHQIIIFLAVILLLILPIFYQQQFLYGSFLTSGYSQLQSQSESVCFSCQLIKSFFLPFGFHPTNINLNFWIYYLSLFWWFSLAALLGLVALLFGQREPKAEIFGYLFLSGFIFFWLVIYYGSWQFSDPVTLKLNTLAVSYVRYWLPLYLLVLPFVAIGLLWLVHFLKKRWQNFGLVILLIILFYFSVSLVLFTKADSLLPVKERILNYKQSAWQVINLTPNEAVIVTVRKDKVFFPERKVIHTFVNLPQNQELLGLLSNLVRVAPVYYYALAAEPTLELNDNLRLEFIKNIGSEVLYQVKTKN